MHAPGEQAGLRILEGKGSWLQLADDRYVVDGGSISAALLGHGHPALLQAVERGSQVPYVSDGYATNIRDEAADVLLRLGFEGEEDWVGAVRLCSSASEANDLALSLARTVTGRLPLVARRFGYHGGIGLAREISDSPLWDGGLAAREGGTRTPPELARGVRFLPGAPTPYGYGAATSGWEETLESAPEILRDAAAVITDYGSNGLVYYPGDYQDRLAEMARSAGALWIADEAVTGLARIGRRFAFQHGTSRPDIVTLGKAIGGGAAAGGAVVISRALAEDLRGWRWMTYSTFRGHAVTAAAIAATVETLASENLLERAGELGPEIYDRVAEIAAGHPAALGVRGEGVYASIALAGAERHAFSRWHGDGESRPLAEVASAAALDAGALIPAYSGLTLWLVPALTISRDELEILYTALDAALSAADGQLETEAVA
jgi:4-aminobutyrate aminotransferase-like enzyme